MGNYIVKPSPSIDYTPLLSNPISGIEETEDENLRVFNLAELKKATNEFKQGKVVARKNGFEQTFYKGFIDKTTFAPSRIGNGIAVSVMECYQDSSEAVQEWKEEVNFLAQISHPNLVKFFGYCCCEDNMKCLLVYEYSHKGSLDHHIFGNEKALPWGTRIKIAIGVAQGFVYLHSVRNNTVYREIGMSNILLDEQYNAKMLHLGSNKLLVDVDFTEVFTEYAPPEYLARGHVATKSDVYTFGVILLELLTGLKALDGQRNKSRKSLKVSTKSFLSDTNQIREIIDPRLVNDYPVNAAIHMGTLIRGCIDFEPKNRPSMQQVLDGLNEIAEIKD